LHITSILSLSFIFSPAFPLTHFCSPFSMVLCYCLLFLLFVCVCVCVCVCVYIYICYVLPHYILAFSSFSSSHFDLHCSHAFSPPKIFNLQPFWGHKMPPSYTTPIYLGNVIKSRPTRYDK
jgi:hypothetical protein